MLGLGHSVGLSLVAVGGGCSSVATRSLLPAAASPVLRAAFSLRWLLLLQSTGSRAQGLLQLWLVASVVAVPCLWSTGSVVGVHGLSCSAVCENFPDEASNPCLLRWQADSLPLSNQ